MEITRHTSLEIVLDSKIKQNTYVTETKSICSKNFSKSNYVLYMYVLLDSVIFNIGTSVISPIIPFSMVLVPAFIIYQKSTQEIYQNHPALYILAFGLVAAKVTNRLVVAHMTKSEMDYMDWSLLGPTMLFLNQYFNTFINEYYVLWLCLIWVTIDLLRYCYQICQEICDYLHVELFRIPYPGGPQRIHFQASTSPLEKNGSSEKKFQSDEEDSTPLLENMSDI